MHPINNLIPIINFKTPPKFTIYFKGVKLTKKLQKHLSAYVSKGVTSKKYKMIYSVS